MPNSQGVAYDVDGPERIIHPTLPRNDSDMQRRIRQLEARLDAVCDWIDNHDQDKL